VKIKKKKYFLQKKKRGHAPLTKTCSCQPQGGKKKKEKREFKKEHCVKERKDRQNREPKKKVVRFALRDR